MCKNTLIIHYDNLSALCIILLTLFFMHAVNTSNWTIILSENASPLVNLSLDISPLVTRLPTSILNRCPKQLSLIFGPYCVFKLNTICRRVLAIFHSSKKGMMRIKGEMRRPKNSGVIRLGILTIIPKLAERVWVIMKTWGQQIQAKS